MMRVWNWQRSKGFVLVACALLAALWDSLFWGHPLGVSVAVFAGALAVMMLLRGPLIWKTTQGRVAAFITGLALVALVEETSTLAVLMICLSVSWLVLVSQGGFSLFSDNVSTWVARWMGLFASLWVRLLLDNVLVMRWLARHPRLGSRITRIGTFIGWWVLPLLAGLIFAGLFALANPVIAQLFSDVRELIAECYDWLVTLSFLRIFMWGLVIVLAYGMLRYRRIGSGKKVSVPPVVQPVVAAWLTGPEMIIRLLVVLNLVFAVENALDIAYLYAGVPLPKGMTYTEYAHRGAYTLIATALLAGIFTLAAFRRNGTAQHSKVCRRMVYLWILQNILLLVSTVGRVWVYVVTGELTRLRMSTMIWCGLVAAGFVWIILRIMQRRTNAWLWRMNALTTLAVLFGCAFINFDGIIADYNVRHCAQAGGRGMPLEIAYLRHLGTTSLPAMGWLQEHKMTFTGEERAAIEAIADDLNGQLKVEMADWRGWTYRRWRAMPVEMRGQVALW